MAGAVGGSCDAILQLLPPMCQIGFRFFHSTFLGTLQIGCQLGAHHEWADRQTATTPNNQSG